MNRFQITGCGHLYCKSCVQHPRFPSANCAVCRARLSDDTNVFELADITNCLATDRHTPQSALDQYRANLGNGQSRLSTIAENIGKILRFPWKAGNYVACNARVPDTVPPYVAASQQQAMNEIKISGHKRSRD